MYVGIDFWKDFGGFVKEKSRHVGIKIEQKSIRRGSGGLLAAKPENDRGGLRSIKTLPKIDEKSTQNRLMSRGSGLPGASWRPNPKRVPRSLFFGPLLGRSWGASWGRLGAGVAVFVLGRLWSSWTLKKSMQKSINFGMLLGIGFLEDFGGF